MKQLAFAKVNLTLDVLHKRADGYHALSTVMASIDLYDELELDFGPAVSVEADFPLPENSAVFRAASGYARLAPGCGARIGIKGRIPSEAGLGGSSADAAGALLAMQAHYGALGEEALFALAASVGADVPFCMKGGLALCEGVGERITPLPPVPLWLIVAKKGKGISTAELFAALRPPYAPPRSRGAVSALRAGDRRALVASISNGLTEQACRMAGDIPLLLARMRQAGAAAASMTGSGSAVFGVFQSKAEADAALPLFADCDFARVCGVNIKP